MSLLIHPTSEKNFSVNGMYQPCPELRWFLFYTFPKAEKVVCQELIKNNYEVFLPLTRSMRVWKNRQKKLIEQVLFPNYIFVKTFQHELYYITQLPKIVTYIHCGGKPSIIPSNVVDSLKNVLCTNQEISLESNYCEGENVRIICGPLAGNEGILVKQNGKTRFGIQLKEINYTVLIDIRTSLLQKINK